MYSGTQKTRIIVVGAPTRRNGSFANKSTGTATDDGIYRGGWHGKGGIPAGITERQIDERQIETFLDEQEVITEARKPRKKLARPEPERGPLLTREYQEQIYRQILREAADEGRRVEEHDARTEALIRAELQVVRNRLIAILLLMDE